MLSILIPIYNYNVFPLVSELHKQCLACKIDFEILCQDDASELYKLENNLISSLSNCVFEELTQNIGRSKARNLLASKAKHEWLLFMDCDTLPCNSDFTANYLSQISFSKKNVFFGGISYKKEKPEPEKLLRWIYGNKREALSVEFRNKKPNNRALTSNLLIKKELFIQNPFDETITKYGYEDLCFLSALNSKKIQVKHINNPAFHLNLETSEIFLAKTRTALENLVFINNSFIINGADSKIILVYDVLKTLKLVKIAALLFTKLEAKTTVNLLSKNPSLFLFDIYKLGYFCKIKSN